LEDDKLLAHDRWFSPASSTTKAGRHDIAEILLKVALSTNIKSTNNFTDNKLYEPFLQTLKVIFKQLF
jgi:hypothetical protein